MLLLLLLGLLVVVATVNNKWPVETNYNIGWALASTSQQWQVEGGGTVSFVLSSGYSCSCSFRCCSSTHDNRLCAVVDSQRSLDFVSRSVVSQQVAARLRQVERVACAHACTRQVHTWSQRKQTRLLSVVSSPSFARSRLLYYYPRCCPKLADKTVMATYCSCSSPSDNTIERHLSR